MLVSSYTEPTLSAGRKIVRINWPLALCVAAIAGIGFLMLFSVAGGSWDPWASRQAQRFGIGFAGMLIVAMITLKFWRAMAIPAYLLGLILLVAVEIVGVKGMGAQRWIDFGFIRLQPSEAMKVALVMALARYYAWLDPEKASRPLWIVLPLIIAAVPAALVLKQPDLGTALLLFAVAIVVMFLAGVGWWFFLTGGAAAMGAAAAVFYSRGTDWQILKDYQYRRIEVFLDPAQDPLGAGYHIMQSKIAFGSGGIGGKGYMQGTQSQLNFLPEKHTDFIFTTLAEELGLIGTGMLLALYAAVILLCFASALRLRDRFGALLVGGLAANFFFYFAVNMAMVMGLAPVVGVPLPLVSFGGSSMLVILFAFGLIQCAHVHRPLASER
jgi:rod shape determining protein RodA